MTEVGTIASPNYSLAVAARAAKTRQRSAVAAAVYDDGILSTRKRRQHVSIPQPWRSPAFIEVSAIDYFFDGPAPRRLSGTAIIAAVEVSFGIVRGDLLTRRKKGPIIGARHAATWLIWKYSAPSINRTALILDRHHTTSINSLRRCRKLLNDSIAFRTRVARIVAWLQPFSTEHHYGGA